jgi:spermidine synthase
VKIAGVALVLLVPFVAVGVMIPVILGARPERVSRLYGADLIGAALACGCAIALLVWLTPPGCVIASALVFVAAGLPGASFSRPLRILGIVLGCGLFVLTLSPRALPDPATDSLKQIGPNKAGKILHSEWHPVFRVDVTDHPTAPGTMHLLHHDGWLGSVQLRFDGNLSELDHLQTDARAIPFTVAKPAPEVLIVGSAGGREVLASLYFGASRVVGVELNPVTYSLVTEHFAEFGGRLGDDPRVTLVNAEARSYLNRDPRLYDLIWLVAPDSYASMNAASSAAFVLSESYLYTVEMIQEALAHLGPGGVLAAQFGERDFVSRPNRTVRFLSTARRALAELGIDDFGDHVMVLSALGLPPMYDTTVLIGKQPFDAEDGRAFAEGSRHLEGGALHWVPGLGSRPGPVSEVIGQPSEQLDDWLAAHPYEVGPVRDDSPFFWHFARFRDVILPPEHAGELGNDWEILIGEQLMLALLALTVLLAAVFLLLPLVTIRSVWKVMPDKATTGLYFACLGAGFMFLEVSLIQRFTLFLGYPTYALSVTLFALLLSSGIGSLASGPLLERRNPALVGAFAGVALMILLQQFVAPAVFDRFVGAALPVRALVAAAMIAPLGLCLGVFMPLGLSSVTGLCAHDREYVAWAWAVNGFFAVITSIASTILAMLIGFNLLLQIALALYAIATLSLWRLPPAAAHAKLDGGV